MNLYVSRHVFIYALTFGILLPRNGESSAQHSHVSWSSTPNILISVSYFCDSLKIAKHLMSFAYVCYSYQIITICEIKASFKTFLWLVNDKLITCYNKYFIRSAVHQIEETSIILHLLPNLFDIILPIFIFKALDYANWLNFSYQFGLRY